MAGVYIAYPFCAQKCTYCNFASGVLPEDLEPRYRNALAAELRGHAWACAPDTLYLGGGTPSRMGTGELAELLANVPGKPWAEATMEAAPGTLTADRLRAWSEVGINRVSLGVQSFVERELRRTGRKHTAETVAAEVALLREAGIGNFNIDLIVGLPGQTRESWRESLDWAERLEAPHVSIYMLEVDEDSRLGQEVLLNGKRFGAPEVPSEDAMVECYEEGVDRLRELGIERYEISNFARPGFPSRHNLKYWRLEPYAGFGADAHSFDGARRWQNIEDARAYVDAMAADGTARCEGSEAKAYEERFFVGLRLMKGMRPEAEERRRYREPIERFVAEGLLEDDGERLRLTRRGVLLSNEVFAEFING